MPQLPRPCPRHMPLSPFMPEKPAVPLDKVQAMRSGLTPFFTVLHTGLDEPFRGAVQFHGRFLQDSADCFEDIRALFAVYGFTPYVRREVDGRIVITAEPGVFRATPSDWRINALLFVLTVFSTMFTGALFFEAETLEQGLQIWRGWPYCLSIMLILGAHEMGHYLAARYHKTAVTLPYFIPFIPPIGTMGAVIRLKAPLPNKRVLLDVGAAGPLAGLLFAIPILFYGLYTSDIGVVVNGVPIEGNSILYYLAKYITFGQFLPNATYDVYLNQVAWAGWVGLLVTALNLMPVGQLDGGHITYALFGEKSSKFYLPVMVMLALLAVVSLLSGGVFTWVVWIILLYFFGRLHAEPLDDVTPLDPPRRAVAIFSMVMFLLVFVPLPFYVIS
ncbi:MAG: site-2 protease family protein [Anaerolineae bacterium]|nr:site-2 protease family protein [Anaerolineae bacterium]